jgi:hypothetical protein
MMIFEFSAPIFKVLLDSKANYLALEIRNSATKEVTFSVIDLKKQVVCLEETGFEEAWRVGLSAIENHVLLLHSYTDNRLPDKKGIFAVDFLAQEVLWEYPTGKFEALHQSHHQIIVQASQTLQDKTQIFLDFMTGDEITPQKSEITLLNTQPYYETHFYTANNEFFDLFCNFSTPYLPQNSQLLGFDYAEIENGFWLLCYYQTEIQAIIMSLLCFDVDGTQLATHELPTQLSLEQLGNRLFIGKEIVCVLLDEHKLWLEVA